jgi:hypothetical protein
MVSMVILTATMFVCPGNVFSDVEKPGCKPFVEEHGTVNVEPTMPKEFDPPPSSPSGSSGQPERRRQPQDSSVNEELCAMYKEYVDLQVKTQGGFQTSGTEELQRWQTLKRMFQMSPPPNCP